MAAGSCNLVLVGSLDTFVVLLTLGLDGVNRLSVESLSLAPFITFLLLLNTGYVGFPTVVGGRQLARCFSGCES